MAARGLATRSMPNPTRLEWTPPMAYRQPETRRVWRSDTRGCGDGRRIVFSANIAGAAAAPDEQIPLAMVATAAPLLLRPRWPAARAMQSIIHRSGNVEEQLKMDITIYP